MERKQAPELHCTSKQTRETRLPGHRASIKLEPNNCTCIPWHGVCKKINNICFRIIFHTISLHYTSTTHVPGVWWISLHFFSLHKKCSYDYKWNSDIEIFKAVIDLNLFLKVNLLNVSKKKSFFLAKFLLACAKKRQKSRWNRADFCINQFSQKTF